jgi:amino acid adenylation domain-containing protein
MKPVRQYLAEEIASTLGRRPEEIDMEVPFSRMGIKSMDLVTITVRLASEIQRKLPATLGFDYPSISAMASFLEKGTKKNQEDDTQIYSSPVQTLLTEHEDASEDWAETVAVVGMGLRFPGGSRTPEEFWRFLKEGGDAITQVPAERWDLNDLLDPEPSTPGKMTTPWGGFLADIDQFDPGFFGISPREARAIDPQQRLILEVGWEALENAGIDPSMLRGGNTGVFVGISGSDYGRLLFKDTKQLDLYSGTGVSTSIAASRLSYFLGLRGPSLAVDTACSSSLVTVDLACKNLKSGACDLALAGGVNLILSPEMTIIFSKAGLMSPDGRCKTFDASANGYVRSEGCGLIVLKRYADAVRDGNRVLALIRGSHVNQDGQSNGLTVPNGQAQISLIQNALLHAGVTPSDVSYIEAHGTGTAIGDPIEMNALGALLGQGRSRKHPLIVGSVKSNIGHLEQAAGIAGVIKVILSLVHETIPPNLHFKKPNPLIDLDTIPAIVPTEPIPWPSSNGSPRVAGVSGFSFGGVNAHVVLQEAPRTRTSLKIPKQEQGHGKPVHLMPLSATNDAALKEIADMYGKYLEKNPGLDMEGVCRTAQSGRVHFPHRLAITGRSVQEIIKQLKDYGGNPAGSDIMPVPHRSASQSGIVFLFTGQGAQYPGMGLALYKSQPVFKKALDQCSDILAEHLDRPLLPIIFGEDGSLLNETAYTQPALFSLEYALACMWQAWGISPAAVMGHSVGEYTAACLAGVFSLSDGLKLIAARGRLIQALPRNGKMAAVFAGVEQVSKILSMGNNSMVSIAAVNGPENVVISGLTGSIDRIVDKLEQEGIKAMPLTVSHAFHSPLMEPMLDSFEKIAAQISFSTPDIPFVSNLTGEMASEEVCDPAYWRKHVRHPVRFEQSVRFLHKNNYRLTLEIGPQPVLTGIVKSFLSDDEMTCLPSLRKNEHDWRTLSEALGSLYTKGAQIDWQAFNHYNKSPFVQLPTYPFQRRRYWYSEIKHKTTSSIGSERLPTKEPFHPQWGKKIETPLDYTIYAYECEASSFYASDHRVYGHAVMSGSTLLSMVLSAMKDMSDNGSICVTDMVVMNPLFIPESGTAVIQVIFHTEDGQNFNFKIHSTLKEDSAGGRGQWKENAYGRICLYPVGHAIEEPTILNIDEIKEQCPEQINPEDFYQDIWNSGLQLKGHFKWLCKIRKGDDGAFAQLREPEDNENFTHGLVAPGLIDSCVQLGFACFDKDEDNAYMFLGYDRFQFYQNAPGKRYCHMKIRQQKSGGELVLVDYRLFTDQGQIIARAEGVHLKRAPKHALIGGITEIQRDLMYELHWQPAPVPEDLENLPLEGRWIVFGNRTNIADQLAAALEKKGILGGVVVPGASFEQTGHNEFSVNPERPEDFSQLLDKLTEGQTLTLGGFINLWPQTGTKQDAWSGESIMADQCLGCATTLHLIQAMTRLGFHQLPALWTVTRGTQAVLSGDQLNPAQSPVWGLHKTMELEHPDLHGGVVDLDPDPNQDNISQLLNHIRIPGPDRYLSFRNGKSYSARLLPMKPQAKAFDPATTLQPGTYLITGGTGGLGLKLAAWLAKGQKAHVVLVGKRPFSMEKLPDELVSKSNRIKFMQADVTRLDELAGILDEIKENLPGLRGIFHLAGVLDDGALYQQKWDRFENVMAAKILGAWHLHQLTAGMELEFFVLFSSIASLMGSPGQGNYSAANAFMDSLSHYRKSIGLPAISINWGPFSQAGMAQKLSKAEKGRWTARGFDMLDADMGFSVLGRLLTHKPAQAGVAKINWQHYLRNHPHGEGNPFYKKLLSQSQDDISQSQIATEEPGSIPAKIRQAAAEDRPKIIEDHICNHVAQILWLHSDEQVDIHSPFISLGLDSLMVLELRKQVCRDFAVELSMTQFLGDTSVSRLTAMVLDRLKSSENQKTVPDVPQLPRIDPAFEQRNLPFALTDVQHAYWIGRSGKFDLGGVSCHVYPEVEIAGLDIEKLEHAVNLLVKRHEMLRAVILPDGRQKILPAVPPYKIEVQDLRKKPSDEVKLRIEDYRNQMSQQILPSETGPLFEIRASLLDGSMTRLHISFDLLIGDGWSFNILIRDLHEYYLNPEAKLPPLSLSFRDYVLAQQKINGTDQYQASLDYWQNRINDLPPAPALPIAKSPNRIKNHRFIRLKSRLDKEVWNRLKKRAANAGLTPSGVLLAAFSEILAVWSKDSRFTINLTMFNRLPLHPQVMDIVGDFTTLTLLEVDNERGSNFRERAGYIQKQLWQDLEHRFVSGIEVIRQMAKKNGDAVGFPVVFTSVLPYSSGNDDKTAIGLPADLDAELKYCISQTPQVWLDHQVFDQDGALVYNWDAVEGLFSEGVLEDMFNAYTCWLAQLAEDQDEWEKKRPHMMPAAQQKMRALYNETHVPVSSEMLHTLFLSMAAEQPDHPAVITSGKRLSYNSLKRRASGIARLLLERGARPNCLVGVVMEKGWEQVVAVTGILMAGAVYMPLDSNLPPERLHYLLKEGEVDLVLTQSQIADQIDWPGETQIITADTVPECSDTPVSSGSADDLAYVIYTSGSTGKPKGVMITHRGAVNTLLDVNRRFAVGSRDRVLALSSLSFDLSVYDVFGTLAAGGTIVMPDATGVRDPHHWSELMMREKVTIWNSAPALMQMLCEYGSGRTGKVIPPSLRLVLMSGDRIPPELPDRIRNLAPDAEIISLGGATEASIWSILHPINKTDSKRPRIPYGKPMANQKFYVLDRFWKDCPDHVAADLYIGGVGLAEGYWKDSEKTAAAFVTHPVTGERLYRTGDIGCFLPEGNIQIIGRNDFQVKIRGHRVELGEIEVAMKQHPGVNNAVVSVKEHPNGERKLAGYIVPEGLKARAETWDRNLSGDSGLVGSGGAVLTDPVERLEFKMKKYPLRRDIGGQIVKFVKPNRDSMVKLLSSRLSYRNFEKSAISMDNFSGFLSSLLGGEFPEIPFPRYQFGSAGGIYPVQTYVYVKDDRIDALSGGVYYYHPLEHSLESICNTPDIQKAAFPPGNDTIFEEAGFAIFFIADMDTVRPMYGSRSREFCLIESGLMTQLLESSCFGYQIGLCQIGELDFESVRHLFRLKESHEYLHCLLGGKICQTSDWTFLSESGQAMPALSLEPEVTSSGIRRFLKQKLPGYMIPSSILLLKTLPLSPNGKVDRNALPAPGILETEDQAKFVPPETALQKTLADLFAQVLKSEPVSLHDSFIDLGGDSLTAVRLTTRVRNKLGVEFPLSALFEAADLEELADHIQILMDTDAVAEQDIRQKDSRIKLDPDCRHDPFPLTDIQQAYWIGRSNAFELGNVATHFYIELESRKMDMDRLNSAWRQLIERHDMLRAVILPDGTQRVMESVRAYDFKIRDLKEETEPEKYLLAVRQEMSHQVIPAESWPLFDIRATRLTNGHIRLHFSMDALIADAWSVFSMFNEWHRLLENPDLKPRPLEITFRDYVMAEKDVFNSSQYHRDREYWLKKLATLPQAPDLPLAVNPDAVTKPWFKRRSADLSARLWGKLKQRAKTNRLTPSSLLISAYAEVLRVWSKTPGITLNVTLFNRLPLHPQVNEIVGDFTSLIPLAVSDAQTQSFVKRARATQQQLLQDLDHRHFGGLEVIREFARQQGKPNKAVFPVVFTSALSMDNAMDASAINRFGDIVFGVSQTPQVWLDHQVMEQDGALVFNWDAVEELFPENLLDDMFLAYCNFLERLATDDEVWHKKIIRFIPLAQLEKRAAANATDAHVSSEMLHTLFYHQASRSPNHPAVQCSNRTLSYAELSGYANFIGSLLRKKGAEPNRLVAVSMKKGWEQIAAVLGVLNSGAAYLPIDPDLPKERIWHLLADGEVGLVLTHSWLDENLQWPKDVTRICVDTLSLTDQEMPFSKPVQGPDDLAYVIYTSGSTGFPKGVMISHRGAVNTILDINQRFELGPGDKTLAVANLNFDLSVYDIFGTLAAGGTIVLPDPDKTREPGHLLNLIRNKEITVSNSVPTLMQMLVEYLTDAPCAVQQSLRLILLSGDWIPVDLPGKIKRCFNGVRVIGLGGATEASIWSNLYQIEQVDPDWKSIPYGYPMINQRYHVLNEYMEDCPDWVPGQLFITGLGLAKGYWRDDEKTLNKFIVCSQKGERLYETGDIGRYLPDGSIEFLGRKDFQVKINGYRIECGEIETAIKQLPGIGETVVIPTNGTGKEKQLVCYVTANGDKNSVLFEFNQADPERCASLWRSVQKVGLEQAAQIPDSIKIETVPAFFNALEDISVGVMCQILQKMGIFSSQGEEYTIGELVNGFGIEPRFQILLCHWLDLMQEKNVLKKTEAGRYLNSRPLNEINYPNPSTLPEKLITLNASFKQHISTYTDLLKGNIDPLELLLNQDSFLAAGQLEAIAPGREYYHNLAGLIFRAIIDSFSSDKPVRVLEMGTRAGSLTKTFLSLLPAKQGSYLYTDESTVFIDKVKQMVGETPLFESGVLDMNKAPDAQGYQRHAFDVIIADKTLHRARHLGKTLKYVKNLLAPGGVLLLIEPTRNNPLMQITVGFFEDGFSNFEDERRKRKLPLISAEKWHTLLEETGFSKIMVLPEAGQAAEIFGQHLIMAQAPEKVRIFDPSQIGSALRQTLPGYMVPARFMLLDKLPLSANMKIDRNALAKLGEKIGPICEKTYVAPSTEVQINIVRVLKKILGNIKIGIHDNFFELGGDSLKAIQCMNLLKKLYPVELSLQEFFEESNVERLAQKIEEKLELEKNLDVEEGEI